MSKLIVRDKKGRILLEVQEDRCVVSRFIDMDNVTKESIIELFTELTGKDNLQVRCFLDFKSEVQEFCS